MLPAMEYKISEYAKKNKVSVRTIWNWIYDGRVSIRRTETGRVRIVIDENKEKTVAVYARVSSSENKDNLERQKERLVSFYNAKGYKVSKVVTEIGSGLNDKRPKLEALLSDNSIDIIVVEHKDRLCRFGLNYIQKLLALQEREIEIVNPVDDDKEDLVQDFVSIITSFCARIYGQRRTKRKTEQLIKELENKD
jgi:predicted site-specific integrase-resolvase